MTIVTRVLATSAGARRLAPATLAAIVPLAGADLYLHFSQTGSITGTVLVLALACPAACAAAASVIERRFVRPLHAARDALARSETRYRALADRSADLVVEIRSGRREATVSPAIKALLGYSVIEARSVSLRMVIHPDDLPRVVAIYNGLSARAPDASTMLRLRQKSGSCIWVEATCHRTTWADGSFETAIRLQDVTERHLEGERLRLATEAARMAQADATDANRAKTEFLARMSHEIRTPLNAVIGFTALLLELPSLPAQGRHYSERIKSAGHALLLLVNDILDFSQVESGTVTLKPVPFALPLLVDECLSIVQQAATAKHLSLDVAIADTLPPGLLGDEARLRQILLNLLNNAIKFTHEGSVKLDIRYDRAGGQVQRLLFSVIDTGIGIDAKDQSSLFQRFRQVDGTIRRTYGGTGLGLAICKQLVELMGGVIGVSSETGRGSTFWFALELPAAPLVVHADAAPHAKPKQPMNLLLVEDVQINQELVCLMLQAGGHTVDVVGNGAEAIMAAEHNIYDAILMDIQMPHVDGLTAARVIRNLPKPHGTVPIIALTANVLPEQARLARAAGMNEVIHKPFTATAIYDLLDGLAQRETPAEPPADGPPIEWPILLKLAGLLGEAKVKALLGSMAQSIEGRFVADAATADGRAALRRDAHSSVAGAGMIGFTLFSLRCQALEGAADDALFQEIFDALKADAAAVVSFARSLAARPALLAKVA